MILLFSFFFKLPTLDCFSSELPHVTPVNAEKVSAPVCDLTGRLRVADVRDTLGGVLRSLLTHATDPFLSLRSCIIHRPRHATRRGVDQKAAAVSVARASHRRFLTALSPGGGGEGGCGGGSEEEGNAQFVLGDSAPLIKRLFL